MGLYFVLADRSQKGVPLQASLIAYIMALFTGSRSHRDRFHVHIQTNVQRAIVLHTGLRGGNRRVWRCPHRAALAAMLTRV